MFERFTDRARRVVVLAQEEARGLNHNYIGTEHILLGLTAVSGASAPRRRDPRHPATLDSTSPGAMPRANAEHASPTTALNAS